MKKPTSATSTDAVENILHGDVRAIGRAISKIENRFTSYTSLLEELFPHTGNATRIGVTGPSGAGKSTLVDRLAEGYRSQGKSIGIIAVDPTSAFSGGAVLGDRIRMQRHNADPEIFIRSMATRGSLGGLAQMTSEAADILDASGKEIILIETVGVGQDEIDIANAAQTSLVVLLPGAGDEIQAIKAGIMEIADIFVINKADQPGADQLAAQIEFLLNERTEDVAWRPPIVETVAMESLGLEELFLAIHSHQRYYRGSVMEQKQQVEQSKTRLVALLQDRLMERFFQENCSSSQLDEVAQRIALRKTSVYAEVDRLLDGTPPSRNTSDHGRN